MGKVKPKTNEIKTIEQLNVSIPYGKGKVKKTSKKIIAVMYQFPMGKVKNNILCCVFSIHHKYRLVN